MALVDLERNVQLVCFEPTPPRAALAALGDQRRWLLYREMVRARLLREIRFALARTCKAAGPARIEQAFTHHLATRPPRTRYFRGVVRGFVESAVSLWRGDPSAPAVLADLATYEVALWDVADRDAGASAAASELAFERPVLLSPAHELLRLSHAVHLQPSAAGAYETRETHLCVHRRRDGERPKTWVLTPFIYELMVLLAPGEQSVNDAVRSVAARRKVTIDTVFLDKLCGVLADFIEAGLILGAR